MLPLFFQRLSLIFLFVCLSLTSFSQKNFMPGYIVRNGDTLSGVIDYRNWAGAVEVVSFKADANGEPLQFRPGEVSAFGVHDEIYVSAVVQTDISPGLRSLVTEDNDSQVKLDGDTVFLQTLIQGDKALYFFKNRMDKPQFYIHGDSSYDLLIYKEYMINRGGNRGKTENKMYLRQLARYLSDCLRIHNMLEDTQYDKRSLEKLFVGYYDCVGKEVRFQKKAERLAVDFGVVAGLAVTTLQIGGYPSLDIEFDPSLSFAPGLSFEVIPPRNRRKWSLYNELNYSYYEVSGTKSDVHRGLTTTYHATLGMSYIKMVNMVRYTHPLPNVFIFFGGGLLNGKAIGETNVSIKETRTASSETTQEGKALADVRGHEQGWVASVGAKYRRGSLEIRYEKGNGMSEYVSVSTATNRFSLLFGYRLGLKRSETQRGH